MRVNKYFTLALAGMAFAACSNENDPATGLGGNGMLEITVQSPMTKAIQTGTTGSSVVVGGDIYVKVYDSSDQQTGETATITRSNPDTDSKQTYTVKIYGVTNPAKVVAYVNDGESVNNDEDIAITDSRLQVVPANIPAYGEATLSTADIQGEMENEGTTYKRYVKSVALQIPVARIELGGLKHKADHGSGSCIFDELEVNGVYLNNIYPAKNSSEAKDTYSWNESSIVGTGNFPILYDEIEGDADNGGVDFLTTEGLPGTGQVYGYNFFAGTAKELPELKIYFGTAVSSNPGTNPIESPRYAVVKTYKNASQQPITSFTPGTIYRITNVELEDKNIGPNENGETAYGVEVTVTEAKWTATDITADWEEY